MFAPDWISEDLNKLNIIHVAGTKGKGSTCAFSYSLLRKAAPHLKIGLCTSPHLVSVRERIRIDGKIISEEDFTRFFFEVWDKLEGTKNVGVTQDPESILTYLKMVLLVTFHTFLCLGVDATILEVAVGGRFDITNVVPKPVVTGITALGIDHTNLLGKTLPEIAWQKAGIFKAGVPAYTLNQPPEALEVVQQEAEKVQASEFHVVVIFPEMSEIRLGIPGVHQRKNASLALCLVHRFLQLQCPGLKFLDSLSPIPEVYVAGLKEAKLVGRCQRIADPSKEGLQWLVDVAHTMESIAACGDWYFTPELALRDTNIKRTLIFNCTGHRSGLLFLDTLLQRAAAGMALANYKASDHPGFLFDQVIFCTNAIDSADLEKQAKRERPFWGDEILTTNLQRGFAEAWADLVPGYPKENVHVLRTIQDAVDLARSLVIPGESRDVLVVGSLYLVGRLISAAKLVDQASS
ncbi:Folylpolyglutamate synthetase [Ceratobasidium sp. 423]|nr:Folylpolyglutamate synthetase [Ceratobasidium sp. 423]